MNKFIIKNKLALFLILISIYISYKLITKFYYLEIGYGYPFFFPERPLYLYKEYINKTFILGILSMIISISFLIFIIHIKHKNIKIKLSIISILISILFHIVFYISSPKYIYNNLPGLFMYTNFSGEYIVNKDRYFSLVKKYGFDIGAYRKFKTLDESIEALDFAMENNEPGLYANVFKDLDRFGYDEAIKKYNDDTFYVYFLKILLEDYAIINKNFFRDNIKYLDNIKLYTINEGILNIVDYILINYNEKINNLYDFNNDINNFFREIYDYYINKFKNINGINKNLF